MSETPFPLYQIYFYLTEGCNLACRHCWLSPKVDPNGTKYPTLSLSLFEKIIAEAKPLGLHTVKLTGGEPLLNPDFLAMIEVIRREDLGLTIETNGTLCEPEHAEAIKKACERPSVSVSLDGVDSETYEFIRGVPGSFAKAIKGIRNLSAQGLKPQIIFTVMKRNRDQVESIVRLAEEIGAGSVKYNIVQPTARGEHLHRQDETLNIKDLITLGRHVETIVSPTTSLKLYFDHPVSFSPLGKIASDGGCSVCGVKSILGVLATGTYALCGIGEHISDLTFGHASTDCLADIWERHPVLLKIREELPAGLTGICGRCLMKNMCLGKCLAQNYYRSGDLMAQSWYCEEAEAAGLFPQSRLIYGLVHD